MSGCASCRETFNDYRDVAGDLALEGGAGQLCTVFSWGTLCASGLIYDTGTAEIH